MRVLPLPFYLFYVMVVAWRVCLRVLFACIGGDTYRMPPSLGDAGNVRGALTHERHGRLRRSFGPECLESNGLPPRLPLPLTTPSPRLASHTRYLPRAGVQGAQQRAHIRCVEQPMTKRRTFETDCTVHVGAVAMSYGACRVILCVRTLLLERTA